jgi:hypothetical protein
VITLNEEKKETKKQTVKRKEKKKNNLIEKLKWIIEDLLEHLFRSG